MTHAKSAALDYFANKFFPYVIISSIVFLSFSFYDARPYIIMFLIYFLDRFSYNVGYSVGRYEYDRNFKNKIDKELDE